MKNFEKLKQLSQGYRDMADIIDEMIAYEEKDEKNEAKEAELFGKFMMKTIEIQSLAE